MEEEFEPFEVGRSETGERLVTYCYQLSFYS
jgi:hypothetical protein